MGHFHPHGPAVGADPRRGPLVGALALIVGFMVAEVVVGLIVGSLALIADAGHLLTDAAAIALALAALRIARRPPRGAYTFGLRRAEIVSAQVNGITLAAMVVFVVVEAVRRLISPDEVAGWAVVVTAVAGVVVNLAAVRLVAGADRSNLGVEGVFQHVVTDLYAFIATAVAGAIVALTGIARFDVAAALVVAALMTRSAWSLLRESGRIFLEAAPRGIDPARIDADLHAMPGVTDVHDLHVWEVTSGFPAASVHLLVDVDEDCHERREAVEDLLASYGITHTTVQVDHGGRVQPLPSPSVGPRKHE
ncbi:MAG: cation diffusion facilitator family transporter [Mycobacteriales bacterium]